MKKLAIKGHPTRGKEVIEILEMLGGKNYFHMDGFTEEYIYYICKEKDNQIHSAIYHTNQIVFTIEEFLEKFPYKIGDKVTHSDYESSLNIVGMKWKNNSIKYEVYTNDYGYWFNVDELQPYKEETMEEKADKAKAPNLIGEDYCGKRFGYKIPNGYEFDCIKNNEIILKPKQPQYPKTFIEVLNFLHPDRQPEDDYQRCYKKDLIEKFQDLLYARDAYWKIVGDEMGLEKSWEPDWSTEGEIKYVIEVYRNNVRKNSQGYSNTILAFPTEEMRDTFYENFKDLIEECKELL